MFFPWLRAGSSATKPETVHLACGANHTLALLELGQVTELWGSRALLRRNESTSIFRPLDLPLERNGLSGYLPRLACASWETTYVVLSYNSMSDVLIAMGANDFGTWESDFHVVSLDHFSEGGVSVESLASGQHHVVVKLKTASGDLIVGWGTSRHGQLGDVDKPFLSAPAVVSSPRTDDAVVHTALGHQHTVFLHSSGTLCGLGANKKHQLEGIGVATQARSVDCTWNGTYITTGDDKNWDLFSAGNNANGQLGRNEGVFARVEFPFSASTHRLLQVACGSEHVLASFIVGASSSTEVWGWGWNEHGNLGVGTTEDVRLPAKIWPPKLSQAPSGRVGIWAGSGTSWIVIQ
ncbi:regulator of chromosome condensation 1/beta-lactamase-inhibitor protein II [Mycena rosella]|uniref:Regulator of chromosome condensation 1/beta-lactamase-inhibitor protein II n=1 Tax=Mycena rosella TaxID=1033263 RepID=A0AAD7GFU3_MYCRO|nr:regulator of chromosome condensation 1/beta-lactamase-inhibitor protein II [Mycena rosella]